MPKLDINANVSKNVTDLANKPIHNLLDKPTAAIGNGLASIFSLVFAPVEYLDQKTKLESQYQIEKKQLYYQQSIEEFKQELENKVSKIPQENLVDPDFHTAYDALEKSKSCITDAELRKMFVNLISSSMNSSINSSVHPSFASIINQMSVLDAKILMTFKYNRDQPIIELREKNLQNGYVTLMTNLFIYTASDNDKSINIDIAQIQNSISSLSRLGLISIDYSQYLVNEQHYSELEKVAATLYDKFSIDIDNRKMQKGVVSLTPLGINFTKVCLPD